VKRKRLVSRVAQPPAPLEPSAIGGVPEPRALDVWQRRAGRSLSNEDLRQIRENLCGFFLVLAEWDRSRQPDSATEDGESRTSCPGAAASARQDESPYARAQR